jgi:hypothetical protein
MCYLGRLQALRTTLVCQFQQPKRSPRTESKPSPRRPRSGQPQHPAEIGRVGEVRGTAIDLGIQELTRQASLRHSLDYGAFNQHPVLKCIKNRPDDEID